MRVGNRLPIFSTVVLFSLAGASAASAQTPPAEDEALTEVVVTAQKRAERLQDVPISITAVSGEALADSRITRGNQLAQLVPNLQSNGAIGDSQPIFSLRGVSMNDYSLNQSGPVATYYDEVYKGNPAILGIALYDLERVEVLRGPQGTLYGKNTTGGAVNLITREPDFATEGYLNVGLGNYSRHEADGAIQAALTDQLAGRLAFTFARADGWFKNHLPGKADMQQTRQWGARGSLLFNATDKLRFTLRAATSFENPIHDAIYAEPGPAGTGAGVYGLFHGLDPVLNPSTDYFRSPGMEKRSTESNNVIRRRNRTHSLALDTRYDIGERFTLTSITSIDDGTFYFEEDADGSPLKVFEESFYDEARQYTQDFRIASTGEGPFNTLIGVYYFREKVFNISTIPLFRDIDANLDGVLDHHDCEDAFPIGCDMRNRFYQRKTSVALYTDDSYRINDRLTIRGGLRFTHDKADMEDFKSQAFGTDDVIVANLIPGSATDLDATQDLDFSTNNLSGKIGLDYKTANGTLLYASFSRGYRGGSFNGQAYFSLEELSITEPEKVTAYEVGSKASVFDRRLQINGAVFYYDYSNQQFIDVNPDTGAQPLVNLPKSRIYGGELEIVARPIHVITLTGGIGLLNTEVREGTLGGQDITGNELVSAPKFSQTLAIDWDIVEASWGSLAARLDGNYATKRYFDLQNRASTTQKAYGLLNARLGWKNPNGKASVDIWARNITNTFYANDRIDVSSGFGFIYNRIGEPRTFGATFGYSF